MGGAAPGVQLHADWTDLIQRFGCLRDRRVEHAVLSPQSYSPRKSAALSLLRARLRRIPSPEPFKIPNCPHGENSEANYPRKHKKGLSNVACHLVLPTFVATNPPTDFLATILYTDIKRKCVMGRPTSLIGINRRRAAHSPPISSSSLPTSK
jgi:hypothetical protein